jgi:hypothetical protein
VILTERFGKRLADPGAVPAEHGTPAARYRPTR